MTEDRFQRIAREIAGHDTTLWLHFLGEPLLHRSIVDFVRFAKGVGVARVGLSTNATLLDLRVGAQLIDAGLDRLECSLDADDRAAYKAVRGDDDFDRVVANVEAFLDLKRSSGRTRPITSIQFLRTSAVDERLDALVERWSVHLADDDFVMTIEPAPFGGAVAVERTELPPRRPCDWLFSALMVLQDGTVTTCGADWDAQDPVGHVDEASLLEIWHGPELGRRREAHQRQAFYEIAVCRNCEDWALADGHGYVNASSERRGPTPVRLARRRP